MIDLHSLNEWAADVWLPWMLRGALQGTLVALVVGGAWLLLRRKASAHLGAALLLLPWIPLIAPLPGLLPIALPVDLHRASLDPAPPASGPESHTTTLGTDPTLVGVDGDLQPLNSETSLTLEEREAALLASANGEAARHPSADLAGASSEVQGARGSMWPSRLPLLAFWLWSLGLLLGVARFASAQARTRRLVDDARPLRDPRARHLLRRAAQEAGLVATPRLLESDQVASPAAWGVLRPTVLLPVGFADRIDDAALGWTLHHEIAHLKRRDVLTAAIVRLLRSALWLHPLAWWLERAGAELRECACDEVALATLPELPRRRAAEALLDVIEAARVAGPRRLALESLHSNKNRLEKRLMRLIDTKRATHLRMSPAAALALAMTAGLGFASTQLTTREPGPGGPLVPPSELRRTEFVAEEPSPASEERELEAAGTEIVEVEPEVELTASEPELQDATEEELIEEEPLDHPKAHAAVALARDYLLSLQRDDGRWETGNPKERYSGEFSDIGVTAFCVELLRRSPRADHRAAADRGLAWIGSQQDPDTGMFGTRDSFCFMPSHAVATSLWFDAHSDGLDEEARVVAERAVEFLMRSRNPYGAWRYESPPIGDNDSFITSLCLSALARAEKAGFEVDENAIRDARSYFDEMTDPDTGRVGYSKMGGPPPRLVGKKQDFPAKYSEYPTSSSIVARLDLGDDPVDEDGLVAAAAVVARVAPRWDPVKGTNDAYHWLWGTRALRPLGGVLWKRWQRGLFEALVPNQRVEGDWPLQDAWSGQNDRAHITAVYGLALEEALRD